MPTINPDVVQAYGKFILKGNLLSAAAATGNIFWFRVGGHRPVTITVTGTFVATVKVYMHNSKDAPSDTAATVPQLGGDVTAPGMLSTELPLEWIGVQVTSYTSGSINADVVAG